MRKTIVTIFLIILSVSLFGQNNLTKVRVTPQWTPQAQFAGIYMAYAKGFYREVGIDVEISHPSASISSVKMLTSGQTDIITNHLIESLMSKDSGIDLVNVLQTAKKNGLLILSRKPVESLYDLKGKKIGRWSSFTDISIPVITKLGIDVDWIPFMSNIALYISGAIDATLCMEYNEFFQLKMSGTTMTDANIIKLREAGYPIPDDGVYVLRDYYEKNPELIENFVKATIKGWNWIRESEANKDETLSYVMELVHNNNIATNFLTQQHMLETVLHLQEDDNGNVPFSLSEEDFNSAIDLLYGSFIFSNIKYEEFVK